MGRRAQEGGVDRGEGGEQDAKGGCIHRTHVHGGRIRWVRHGGGGLQSIPLSGRLSSMQECAQHAPPSKSSLFGIIPSPMIRVTYSWGGGGGGMGHRQRRAPL